MAQLEDEFLARVRGSWHSLKSWLFIFMLKQLGDRRFPAPSLPQQYREDEGTVEVQEVPNREGRLSLLFGKTSGMGIASVR